MSENPALNLMRVFFTGAGFQEVPATKTYTRDDIVRAIVGQQWAVAIACCDRWGTFSSVSYIANVVSKFPCAVDVVEGMEQS